MPTSERPRSPALVVLAVLGLLAVAAFLVLGARMISAPARLVVAGGEALRGITEAFRQGQVEESFRSFATEVSGGNRLQFATLRQHEVFERKETSSLLWGQLPLPELLVQISTPVEYGYYVDLEGPWKMRLVDSHLEVEAPPIEHNPPAVDVSQMEYRVAQSSLLADEDGALEALRRGLTPLLEARADAGKELVRELGRRKVEDFVRGWVIQDFGSARDLRIVVRFSDDSPETPLRLPIELKKPGLDGAAPE